MDEMTTRERFRALMNFRPVDRLPIVEWAGWWTETLERWRAEGLPPELDRYGVCRYFGLDVYKQTAAQPLRAKRRDLRLRAPTLDAYLTLCKDLYPTPAVDARAWETRAREQASGDIVLSLVLYGFFWFPRTLFGKEEHLYAFYDHPELMHRINGDLADWTCRVLDEVLPVCRPDFVQFSEDLSYNLGPMLSRDHFDEFLRPYYERVLPRLKDHGILAIVDSDGNVTEPAAWFEAAGLDGVLPLERRAGCDVAVLRAAHPRMRFLGHFDKLVMDKGERAMRREFERLLPSARKGGYLISCDHQTPPGVSLEDYKLYVRLFGEYAARV